MSSDDPPIALVADAEQSCRRDVVRVMHEHGLRVIEAEDGDALLLQAASLAERGQHVAVVVSAIALPHCDGIEAARRLAKLFPSLRIILTSAFGDAATLQRASEAGASAVLRQPFASAELASLIAELRTPRV